MTQSQIQEAFGDVVVTNHAVRRFAERADRVRSPARLDDRDAVRYLADRGYPVDAVRTMLAAHAEPGVRIGANKVRLDRIMLVIQGRTVVTCSPRG